MKTIYKFPIYIDKLNTILANSAEFIHFERQEEGLMVWAIVDTDKPSTYHCIIVVGTGWDISRYTLKKHIGTVQTSGQYVWHAFEIEDPTQEILKRHERS